MGWGTLAGLLRVLRSTLVLLSFGACTAEPACIDGIGRTCGTNADCDQGDGCREIVGRGFFCAPPDGSGVRIVNSALSSVTLSEGVTARGLSVRNGRFRGLPRAAGITTESRITVVEGDLK